MNALKNLLDRSGKMPRYLVETISTFRHTYWVEAKEASHAADEVVMDAAEEFTQKHLGELISNVREVSDEEAEKVFFTDHNYLVGRNIDLEQYLHKINY
jgi:hypothetical protein